MARPRDHEKHISAAVEELLRSVSGLARNVDAAVRTDGGRVVATGKAVLSDGRAVVTDAKRAKLRKALKAYWAKMKGKAREERLARMAAGRNK